MKISVIIATRNRPSKLYNCLKSISSANRKPFEVIVIDQSDLNQKITKSLLKDIGLNIKLYCQNQTGVSCARNKGITLATGEVIAFTDDDCIISENWIEKIYDIFNKDKKVVGIFGKVVVYKPRNRLKLFCPVTEVRIKKSILIKDSLIYKYGWFICGGNMALRRSYAIRFPFADTLGNGSIGLGSDDLELCYRLLKDKLPIYYEPEMIVYHDKWINIYDQRLPIRYERGFVLFHVFYLLYGDRFIRKILTSHLRKVLINQYRYISDSIIHLHPRMVFWEIYFFFEYLFSWLIGTSLGIYFRLWNRGPNLSKYNKSLL